MEFLTRKNVQLYVLDHDNPLKVDILQDTTFKVTNKMDLLWEERLKLRLNPKPSWMPKFVWVWLIRLVLTQEITIGRQNEK